MPITFVSLSVLALLLLVRNVSAEETPPIFGVPLVCDPTQCLVQQFPDMQAGAGTSDPFCGRATYEKHDGTDIRIHSLKDIASNVPVVAMAAGKILRERDGEPDRLSGGIEAANTFGGKECGNGLVIDHGNGWETQYCHMKQGSLAKPAGTTVAAGETIGFVGSSGWAQFPHVHVTVRHGGVKLDPSTGRVVGSGCAASAAERHPLWSPIALDWMRTATHHILDVGLAGSIADHNSLVADGPPPAITAGAEAIVGWGWFSNLQDGDQIRLTITDPSATIITRVASEPIAGHKASYSHFAGRKRNPVPGRYELIVDLLRSGTVIETRTRAIEVAP
jgi:hypothetical protein